MAKRFADLIFSTLGLIVTFPLFLVIALAIKTDSKGTVFFKHKRVGQHGVLFLMYKFRTMVKNAASIGPAVTYHEDARITKVGHLLRQTKLDELPNLINVWKGEMSFVGPRPEAANYVEHYTQEQQQVLTAKPGITGPAQIEWRNEASRLHNLQNIDKFYIQHIMPQKLALDLKYVHAPPSVLRDLRYMFLTFKAILAKGCQ